MNSIPRRLLRQLPGSKRHLWTKCPSARGNSSNRRTQRPDQTHTSPRLNTRLGLELGPRLCDVERHTDERQDGPRHNCETTSHVDLLSDAEFFPPPRPNFPFLLCCLSHYLFCSLPNQSKYVVPVPAVGFTSKRQSEASHWSSVYENMLLFEHCLEPSLDTQVS